MKLDGSAQFRLGAESAEDLVLSLARKPDMGNEHCLSAPVVRCSCDWDTVLLKAWPSWQG